MANRRTDYLHKLTTDWVKTYDRIALEALKTKNMMKNHQLAGSIANGAWGELCRILAYKCKCEWYGKELVLVNPRKTSQICSACGPDDGKHDLSIRE